MCMLTPIFGRVAGPVTAMVTLFLVILIINVNFEEFYLVDILRILLV